MTSIWLICYIVSGMPYPLNGWLVTLIICLIMDIL